MNVKAGWGFEDPPSRNEQLFNGSVGVCCPSTASVVPDVLVNNVTHTSGATGGPDGKIQYIYPNGYPHFRLSSLLFGLGCWRGERRAIWPKLGFVFCVAILVEPPSHL